MKKVEYFSTDKLYKVEYKGLSKNGIFLISLVSTVLLFIVTVVSFMQSVTINSKDGLVKYNETGNVDYKIYLKDNNYYDTSYLGKGMQYVASLIKTVNVNFNYGMQFEEDIDYLVKYKVTGEVQITERDDPSRVLYTKTENIIDERNLTATKNEFSLSTDVDIDYDKYNAIVNSYKKEYGLVTSSNLILTLEVNTQGNLTGVEDGLNKANRLQIVIPLSEQTVNIKMNTEEIHETGTVISTGALFKVHNQLLFIIFVFVCVVFVANLILDIYLYLKDFKKDVYKSKVDRILRDYDRIIVNGRVSIDENRFSNKVYPESFEEMVDAAQQLESPIYFYEVIPNEKCFFVIAKDSTLYKYRLTKAFLEKNNTNKFGALSEDDESVNKFNFVSEKKDEVKDDEKKEEHHEESKKATRKKKNK